MLYKAFMSYSHAADGKLAPAFQAALQRFAKPWYRLRAIRVFRDKTSLSVNPGLWSSIEAALSNSEYFLCLASPEAAKSPWTQREVAYWLANRSAEEILIVLTDGELAWDGTAGEFDGTRTNALPPALQQAFTEQPRYVEMRWAKSEDQLSPKHPDFLETISDVAATLHNRPKDELVGEDVRQHRRTLQIAWAAVSVLVVIAIVAATAAVFAVRQRNEAVRQRENAEEQQRIALSRQLAAQALNGLDSQLDLSLLLSVEARRIEDTSDATSSLLAGLVHRRHLLSILSLRPDAEPPWQLALSPDGHTLAVFTLSFQVEFWDIETGQLMTGLRVNDEVKSLTFSPDGQMLAVALPTAVEILDMATDDTVATIGVASRSFESQPIGEFTPDGRAFAVRGVDMVSFWETETGRQIMQFPVDGFVKSLAFSPDGRKFAVGFRDRLQVWDMESAQVIGELLASDSVESLSFTADGETLAAGTLDSVGVWEIENDSLRKVGGNTGFVTSVAFSPDDTKVIAAGENGTILVWDLTEGQSFEIAVKSDNFRGPVALGPHGDRLAAIWGDKVTLWQVDEPLPVASALLEGRLSAWQGEPLVTSLAYSPDGQRLLAAGSSMASLWDLSTHQRGEFTSPRQTAPCYATFTTDGRQIVSLVSRNEELTDGGLIESTITYWDAETLTPLRDLRSPIPLECSAPLAISPDGTALAVSADLSTSVELWDIESGQRLRSLPRPALSLAFSPDGNELASFSAGKVSLWDLKTGQELDERFDTALRGSGLALGPTGRAVGRAVATGDLDGAVNLWSLPSWQHLGKLPRFFRGTTPPEGREVVQALAFSPDGKMLATGTVVGTIVLWDIDVESWEEHACRIAKRNLTRSEWDRFIGPGVSYLRTCPDLPPGAGTV